MISLPHRPAILATFTLLAAFALPVKAMAEEVTVFAAASLKTALDDVVREWESDTGNAAAVSYAGSSSLAKQIAQGAPADLFISAAVNWMDHLQDANLIKPETRVDLLGNSLVLVAHGRGIEPVAIDTEFDLPNALGDGKLAMALVESVPAGVYGKAALSNLGLWDKVSPQVAQADNVRAALALVATGEAPLGIVYATDAVAEPDVHVVGIFPAETHAPIIYPAAVIKDSATPSAEAFLAYLSGPKATAIFESQGFQTLRK